MGSAFPKVPAGMKATGISVLFRDFELLPHTGSGLKMLPLSRELVIQSVLKKNFGLKETFDCSKAEWSWFASYLSLNTLISQLY